jgi:general secretion pathway protein E
LVDIGVPPYLMSATVIGVLAQRLVRTLCPICKEPDPELTHQELARLAAPGRLLQPARPYRAVGCPACRQTGYRGRAALYELMEVSEAVRATLHPQPDLSRLRQQAVKEGLRPLRTSGVLRVAEGMTTLDEVLRCTPRWEDAA